MATDDNDIDRLQREPLWKDLAFRIANDKAYPYGVIIKREILAKELGLLPLPANWEECQKYNIRLMAEIARFRDEAKRKYKVHLETIPHEGLRKMPPNEHAGKAVNGHRKIVWKSLFKHVQLLKYTPMNKMNPEERTRHQNTEARMFDYARIETAELAKLSLDLPPPPTPLK
jgi:hypothetical protein